MSQGLTYFACGADLLHCERLVNAGEASRSTIARAHGRRVAFGAGSDRGVTVPAPGLVAWGAVYEIADAAFLDIADNLATVTVKPWNDDAIPCRAPAAEEVADERRMPAKVAAELLEHARGHNAGTERGDDQFPEGFLAFLADAAADGVTEEFPAGALIAGRLLRQDPGQEDSEGGARLPYAGLAFVSPADAARAGVSGPIAAVFYRGRACPVEVVIDEAFGPGMCQMSQQTRAALGILGRYPYGQRVELAPLRGALRSRGPIAPRPLILRHGRPNQRDSEKNIVVLHDDNLTLLGVSAGDYVRVRVAKPAGDETGEYELTSASLRAYPGLGDASRDRNTVVEYPRVERVYIDAYGRTALGLKQNDTDFGVVVTADVLRLFLSRIVFYGGTLLLSLAASRPLNDALGTALTVVIAVVVTLAVTLFDLQSKVHYGPRRISR